MIPRNHEAVNNLLARHPDLISLRLSILDAVDAICECHHRRGNVLVCGNGGSAADGDHIVGELVKAFRRPRRIPGIDRDRLEHCGFPDWELIANGLQQGVSALSLSAHCALTTAIQNDISSDMVFAQQGVRPRDDAQRAPWTEHIGELGERSPSHEGCQGNGVGDDRLHRRQSGGHGPVLRSVDQSTGHGDLRRSRIPLAHIPRYLHGGRG